ncbi:hypothetical protein TR75_10150 [Hydrogenibacillus schlegelii]|uniref:Uncharacterized protein n=2 Tax=Hydrogenibacillus schlegelii TaxID=1484 RepID=A0A132MH81_HYDSH|nr:hypothetical protein TR75_10150 [Hydrogenibacillus schlegelii]OAR05134.1 hypothetical protein SA87_08260 [Hydrogenibacillus schlegelii]
MKVESIVSGEEVKRMSGRTVKRWRLARDERGGVGVLIVVGLTAFAILVSVFFTDVFTVFTGMRMNQTAADAAALAAAREATKVYIEALQNKLEGKIVRLDGEVDREAWRRYEDDCYESCGTDADGHESCSTVCPPSIVPYWNAVVADWSVPGPIVRHLPSNPNPGGYDPTVKIPLDEAVRYFYRDDCPAVPLCGSVIEPRANFRRDVDAAIEHALAGRIRSAAEEFAGENGAYTVNAVTYVKQDAQDVSAFAIQVTVERRLSFLSVDARVFSNEPAVHNAAAADIDRIRGLPEAYYDGR